MGIHSDAEGLYGTGVHGNARHDIQQVPEAGLRRRMRLWRRLPSRPHRVGSAPDPRFSFANERTFLAWNRTALAVIGGGLAAEQLLNPGPHGSGRLVGVCLIALGGVITVGGYLRWHASELAMRLRAPLPLSRIAPMLFALGTAAFALLSLVLVVIGTVQ